MATHDDVRRLALALPEVVEESGHFAFSVIRDGKARGFAWIWMQRTEPGGPRSARPDVLALRVVDHADKMSRIAGDPTTFFSDVHDDGFPALLVRLDRVDEATLRALLDQAWRSEAPAALVRDVDLRAAFSR